MINIADIQLITDRLILRNMKVADVTQDYADWLNDPEINKYLSCANVRQTIEFCSEYVRSFEFKNDAALIGIFLKENNLHIGNITLFPPIDWHNKKGTIGISIGRKNNMAKGYAKEALLSVVAFCFGQLKLHRIQAGVRRSNVNSMILFLKCGFSVEGILRETDIISDGYEDGYILSILEDEYLKNKGTLF